MGKMFALTLVDLRVPGCPLLSVMGPRQRNRIQEIKANTSSDFLPDISNEDSVVWIPSRNGIYSVKSAWEAIRVSHGAQEWCHIVWFPNLSLDGHLFYGWPCNAYLLLRRGC